jgi:hypothetical protein
MNVKLNPSCFNTTIFCTGSRGTASPLRLLEAEALDSLDEVSSGEMEDYGRANGNVSDLWDQVSQVYIVANTSWLIHKESLKSKKST